MRLIDADRLLKAFCGHCEDYENCKTTCFDFRIIQTQPTVDAVPVVRCKDCKHFEQFRPHDGFCTIDGMLNDNDHFCSYGERKGGDE